MTEPTDENTGKRLTAAALRVIGYLIYAYLIFVEIILFLGFFLLLFGANTTSSFVQWVYRSLDRAMEPFRGIFEPIDLGTTSGEVPAVFDTSVLFAMIIYGIVAIALHSLLDWLSNKIDRIDRENRLRAQQAAYEAAAEPVPTYPTVDTGAAAAAADPAGTTSTPTPPPPPTPPTA